MRECPEKGGDCLTARAAGVWKGNGMREEQKQRLLSLLRQKKRLLLTGTPGVGKTFLAQEVAKNGGMRYFTFELPMDAAFCEQIRQEGLLSAVQALTAETWTGERQETFLYLLDGVEALGKEALQKLLFGPLPEHLILITSRRDWFFGADPIRLPEEMREETVLPYDFEDFLRAMGNEWYLEILKAHAERKKPIPELVLEELNDCLYDYLLAGGYPTVVRSYQTLRGDLGGIRAAQKRAYAAIALDLFSEEALPAGVSATRLRQLLRLVAEASDRFSAPSFTAIRKGATKQQFQGELSYLLANGLLLAVERDGQDYRYEFTDSGLLRYFRTDYEPFLHLEEAPCPKYILQQYVYSTLWRYQIPVQSWRSGRGAQISFFSRDGSWALDCSNHRGGYRRNQQSFLREHPDTKLYTCGLSPEQGLLYVALEPILKQISERKRLTDTHY
ncbi:MAG: AAA family ATPase [Lachnospiraceae bacterium]|nr:AAA family ATPase [Lachnospiraceae bacterium]